MIAALSRQSDDEARPAGPGFYVYGVTRRDAGLALGAIGIVRGTYVYPLEHHELAAVVSETPLVEFDPTRENIAAHGLVVEMLMRRHPVVPLPFGTVLDGEESVRDLLAGTYDLYDQLLRRVQDKVEVTVRVTWDRDAVRHTIEREDMEVRELAEEISRNIRGSTFFRRAQLARLVEERLAEHSVCLAGDLLAAIGPIATAVRRREPTTDRTLLLASVLLDRHAVPRLYERVDSLLAEHRSSMTVTIGPPRSPQEFVTTRLELDRGRGR